MLSSLVLKSFCPLIKDLKSLEQTGVFVKTLNNYVKGSVFCVSADNLGAHALAGFQESFNVNHFCRFCLTNRGEIATTAISDFQLRSREQHNTFLLQVHHENVPHENGVKRECVLSRAVNVNALIYAINAAAINAINYLNATYCLHLDRT